MPAAVITRVGSRPLTAVFLPVAGYRRDSASRAFLVRRWGPLTLRVHTREVQI
jgi:hypothetical protein